MIRHPSIFMTAENNEQICAVILKSRMVTVHEVANQLQINHSFAYEIIHNKPIFIKSAYDRSLKQLT